MSDDEGNRSRIEKLSSVHVNVPLDPVPDNVGLGWDNWVRIFTESLLSPHQYLTLVAAYR